MLRMEESPTRTQRAPNALYERMRRRVGRVGLLVAFMSSLLAVIVIFVVCACAHVR